MADTMHVGHASLSLKPRHKWGWIFVAVFVIQFVLCSTFIYDTSRRIKELDPYLYSMRGSVDNRIRAQMRVNEHQDEIYIATIVLAILSAGTLYGSYRGLQRKR